jgi:mRNA interferase MazF
MVLKISRRNFHDSEGANCFVEVFSFDEIISEEDSDFTSSGLKFASVIRIGRLAVVQKTILVGAIGEISNDRLTRIKNRLSDWLIGK